MMKKSVLKRFAGTVSFLCSLFFAFAANAQVYNMSTTPVSTCAGTYYDNGGAGGNYNDAVSVTQTFTSDNGNRLKFVFSYFSLYNANDVLRVYDGPDNTYPLIGTYSGGSPGTIESSGTTLTFVFSPNNGGTSAGGWAATISCTTPALTVYNMSTGTVNACTGVFYDNAGANASYAMSEDRTQTFCSDNGEFIQFDFIQNSFGLASGDTLFIYDGATTSANSLAVLVAGSIAETVTSSGTCLTFRFKSDATTNSRGWQAIFSCTSTAPPATSYNISSGVRYTCGGSFFDDGGAGGNYDDASSHTQTFKSYNGNRLSFAFSYFSTYNFNDVLRIYDGPDASYPLIGAYSTGSSPGTVKSTGDALTFVYSVNNGGTSAGGWAATISCTTPALTVYDMSSGTVNSCSGVFYDNGGANAAYSPGEDRTQTFCSDNGQFVQFDFNQNGFSLGAGDSLFVYDGASTSANPLAILVSGSIAETVTSTGTCLTFRFKSDATTNNAGWQAAFSCVAVQPSPTSFNMSSGVRYTCGGSFFDDGGSGGNYNDAASHTQTFASYNGNRISFNFTSFSLSGTADVFRIYDGPNSTYPLIGSYVGGSSPGVVTSTGSSLTFVLNVNNQGTSAAGWAATISCTTPALTVYDMSSGTVNACSGVFYDNGGANAQYPNSEDRTQTFCSDNGQFIQFDFNQVAFSIGAGDSLFIYDGPSTSSNPLAILVSGSIAETVTSSGTCLTFRFKSDAVSTANGWQAVFTCVSAQPSPTAYNISSGVRYTCNGSFYDDGGAGGNYNDAVNHTQTFVSYNGNRLTAAFSSFSTATGADILRIYDGPNSSYPLIGAYANGSNPGTITSTGSSLTFVFNVNNLNSSEVGWAATFSCSTPVLTTYDMSSGTVNACEGVFYDNAGANANYPLSENRTQTFCSDNGEYIQFDFNQNAFSLASGDSLFIYDGPSTSSNPLAILVSGSNAETVTSSGTCLTFRFSSNATTVASGWQAAFTCVSTQPAATSYLMSSGVRYTCGGSFYDDGGSGGNYNDAVNHTQTFTSYNGNRLSVTFTSFSTATTADILRIYDGPDNTYPFIGSYAVGSNPGTITSTGTSLTFVYNVNNAGSSAAGWAATFSCTTPVLPVYDMSSGTTTACSGVFYDNAGANTDYPASENRTQTFCSDNGEFIEFTFNNNAFNLAAGDSLFVYDGSSVSSQPLAIFVGGSHVEKLTSSGTCLTFRFKSDAVSNASGWQATFACTSTPAAAASFNMSTGVRYTCGATFYDNGGPSGNYDDYTDRVQTFVSTGGCALRATFTSFSTSTTADYLRIYDGMNTSAPLIGTYSTSSNPGLVQASGNALTFQFITNSAGSSTSGWVADLTCPGQTAPPVVTSNSPVCEGDSIKFTTSNIPGATFSWSGPNGFTSSAQSPVINNVDLSDAGGYMVTATVGGCTSSQTSVNVVVNSRPASPVASNSGPVCSGNSLNLTSSTVSGATYVWNGPDGFSSTSQNPIISSASINATGTYTVVATAGVCSVSGTTIATVNPTPQISNLTSNGPVCEGSTLTLSASGSNITTYTWNGPDGFSGNTATVSVSSATVLATGTYTLTAANANCSSAATIQTIVSATPLTPVVTSNSPVCENSALNLTATSTSGVSYSWNGPSSFSSTAQNPVISSATSGQAGTYTVTASINGCTSQETIIVEVNPVPAAPAATNDGPICNNGVLNLSATTVSGATYEWTGPNGFTSTLQNPFINTVTFADAGVYSVTASINGCESSASSTTVIVNTVAPTVSTNGVSCEGDSLQLNASLISGATYSWTGPNGFSSSLRNPVINPVSSLSSGTYSVTANIGGCVSAVSTVYVSINTTPSAPVASNNGPLCSGDQLQLSASTIAGATYVWSGPQGFSSSSQNPLINNITVNKSGTYTVHVVENGCSSPAATTMVVVTQKPGIPSITTNDPLCEGGTLILGATNVANATYAWTGPNGFTSTDQNPVINNVPANAGGNYSVIVSVNGCSSSAGSENVTIYQAPAPPVITINSMAGTLQSSYSNNNQWYLNGSMLNGEIGQFLYYVMYGSNGPYTVTYTDINGCTSTSAPYNINAVGISALSHSSDLNIYPNPSNGDFIIDFSGLDNDNYLLKMINSIGEIVYHERIAIGSNKKNSYSLPVAAGMYTISVSSNEREIRKTIIINR